MNESFLPNDSMVDFDSNRYLPVKNISLQGKEGISSNTFNVRNAVGVKTFEKMPV